MSGHIEKLNELFDELGPSTNEVTLIEHIEPQTWLIALETYASAIAIRLDTETGIATLSCELGRPQEEEKLRIYEALLTYNGLAEMHGGIRMSLREPDGAVLQEFDVALRDLQVEHLRNLVLDFSKKASAWEEIIESAESPEPDDGLQNPAWDALRA